MSLNYYEPVKNTSIAYHKDSNGNEYFGKAAIGSKTSDARWTIFKMEYAGVDWAGKYPVDSTTGLGSDAPKFIWDNADTYAYRLLGT